MNATLTLPAIAVQGFQQHLQETQECPSADCMKDSVALGLDIWDVDPKQRKVQCHFERYQDMQYSSFSASK